jgi:hypothetical protein
MDEHTRMGTTTPPTVADVFPGLVRAWDRRTGAAPPLAARAERVVWAAGYRVGRLAGEARRLGDAFAEAVREGLADSR